MHMRNDEFIIFLFDSFHADGQAVRSTGLYFLYVSADRRAHVSLCRKSNDRCTVFDQSDCTVLQFPAGESFCLDIGDLFQFQRTLNTDIVVDTASDEETVARRG